MTEKNVIDSSTEPVVLPGESRKYLALSSETEPTTSSNTFPLWESIKQKIDTGIHTFRHPRQTSQEVNERREEQELLAIADSADIVDGERLIGQFRVELTEITKVLEAIEYEEGQRYAKSRLRELSRWAGDVELVMRKVLKTTNEKIRAGVERQLERLDKEIYPEIERVQNEVRITRSLHGNNL